jgi:ATP-binding cassette subfamily B multidrug efflux pump
VLAAHGLELILAALFVLTIRTIAAGSGRGASEQRDPAAIRHAGSAGARIGRCCASRWVFRERLRRAHRQPDHADAAEAGEAVFQIFDAITFALAYLVGAAILLFGADPRLLLPLRWFALYGLLLRWTIVRIGPASQASADARSATTGRIVDSYTNIHAVKLFAHHDREIDYAKEAIETHAPDLRPGNAAVHDHGCRPDDPERASDRGGCGLGGVALGGDARRSGPWRRRRR